jgi:hypothetical protein
MSERAVQNALVKHTFGTTGLGNNAIDVEAAEISGKL